MYEDKNYEIIMEEALQEVTSEIDKREGSLIYDAIGPCAYQLAQTYYKMDNFIDLVMVDTAVGAYLDRKAAEFGITRKFATASIREVITTAPIDTDTRWELNGLVYRITSIHTDTSYSATCETKGTIGNADTGVLTSLDNISGVTANIAGVEIYGTEEESDDALRQRVYDIASKPSASGNATDYKTWATSVVGVGDARVFPTWNGAGTVKVLIVDNNKDINPSLENDVAEYIEASRPIGANVTVDSPDAKEISVTANVTLFEGATLEEVQQSFNVNLKAYLRSLVFKTYSVSYAKIGAILLDTEGVSDYTGLMVNDGTASISIGTFEAPAIGTITLSEVV